MMTSFWCWRFWLCWHLTTLLRVEIDYVNDDSDNVKKWQRLQRRCLPRLCSNKHIQYTVKCKRSLGFRTELLVDVVWVTCSANAFVMATHATHPTNHLQVLLKFPKNMEGKPQTNTEIHQPDLGFLRWLSMTWWCLSWPWPFDFANRFYSFWVVVDPVTAQWVNEVLLVRQKPCIWSLLV